MKDPVIDPAAMSPAQRRQEIAAILGKGVLRLRQAAQSHLGSHPFLHVGKYCGIERKST